MSVSVVYAVILACVLLLVGALLGRDFWKNLGNISGNFVLGYGSLALLNCLGAYLSFAVPVNAVTLLAGGCLGLPGTLLAAALQFVA
jgi:pro-sigmaK processing inhibitor BofA